MSPSILITEQPDAGAKPADSQESPKNAAKRSPRKRLALGAAGLAGLLAAGSVLGNSDALRSDSALSMAGADGANVSSFGAAPAEPMLPQRLGEAEFGVSSTQAFDDASEEAADTAGSAPASLSALANRDIIRTATIDLRVTNIEQAVARARAAATAAGGFVANAEVRSDGEGFAVMTLRVPSENLESFIAGAADFGTVIGQRQGSQDVTGAVSDVEAQLRNLRALEIELLTLLEDARERFGSTGEVLAIFNEVRQTRDEIERLEGRQASLRDQVSLSTVTLNMELPRRSTFPRPVPTPDPVLTPTQEAFEVVKSVYFALGNAIIFASVALVPILAMVGIPLAGMVWLGRRRLQSGADAPKQDASA